MKEIFTIDTPIGRLGITVDEGRLEKIQLNNQSELSDMYSVAGQNIVDQIVQYFDQPDFIFDLPLLQTGTEHQLKVWKALSKIPSGKTMTYGQLANKIGSSARAIGNACRNNPIPLVVPCHRIVAAAGIGGFSGAKKGVLLTIKRDLLFHEGLCY